MGEGVYPFFDAGCFPFISDVSIKLQYQIHEV